METTVHFSTSMSLSQLAKTLRDQLPSKERLQLAFMLQEDDEPTKEQILNQLKEDYIALQKGTLKTRSLKDVLNEL